MGHDVALGFVAAGVAVAVLSALGALAAGRDHYLRLHYVTPITSLAGPLVGIGLTIQNGWGLTSGEILLVVGLLAVSGPVAGAATGRLFAQADGTVRSEAPE
ncbi:MAG TPA: monovalent cation/H(+) antiporter subunit G [Acidimicrobiales bacterium]|jgi:multicomponent Na+:H+ antiporter subunit G|nr:monovalent cation/H(+) antiporter subunit G [Acidimicrobiales bacterium]